MKGAREILRRAIETYGPEMMLTVAIDKMTELTKELCKYKKEMKYGGMVVEKIADVEIAITLLKMAFEMDNIVGLKKRFKIEELARRLCEREGAPDEADAYVAESQNEILRGGKNETDIV